MALIIDLKHSERLHIEGTAPILREKDIMLEDEADSPCKKIYFTVQLMYISPNPEKIHKTYFHLIEDIQHAAPSTSLFFSKINTHILNGEYYKALKEARNLMEHEREMLANV